MEVVRKTCDEIETAGGAALAQLEKEPYRELLISSVQLKAVISVFRKLGFEQAVVELEGLPELSDYELRED